MHAAGVFFGDSFEPPHVITDVRAPDQFRFREIGEVAIDRGAVSRLARESIGDIAVRHRRVRRSQQLEHREARWRGAQAFAAHRRA